MVSLFNGTPHNPKLLDWSLTIKRFCVISMSLVRRGDFTPLQKCSWRILQTQSTGLCSIIKIVNEFWNYIFIYILYRLQTAVFILFYLLTTIRLLYSQAFFNNEYSSQDEVSIPQCVENNNYYDSSKIYRKILCSYLLIFLSFIWMTSDIIFCEERNIAILRSFPRTIFCVPLFSLSCLVGLIVCQHLFECLMPKSVP